MGNYRALPYSDSGYIFASVKYVDNEIPNDAQKLLLYNEIQIDNLISIDLRKIKYKTITLTITGKIEKNKKCTSTIIRLDSAWTNYSIIKSINQKETRDSFDYFSTDIVINKGNISGKCEIRCDYLDHDGQILGQSKIFFLQSDGRAGPDFKDGLFIWNHTDFLVEGDVNQENLEYSWYQQINELNGLKNLFAIELQEKNPINILINDSIEGNIVANINQLSDEEKTVNNLLYLIMGYGPFLIEVFKIYLYLYKTIETLNEEVYLNNDALLVEENKVSLNEKIQSSLKEIDEHDSKKMIAISQLLFPSQKNSPEGSLIYLAELGNNLKFNEIMQKATSVYQKDLFQFDKKISNHIEKIRNVLRNSNRNIEESEEISE